MPFLPCSKQRGSRLRREPSSEPRRSLAARLRSQSRVRLVTVLAVFLVLLVGALPSAADLADEIKKLEQQREEVQQDRQEKVKQVEAADAEADDLAAALAVMNSRVNEQESRLSTAEAALAEAEQAWALASQAVVNQTNAIENLKVQITDRAVAAFVGQDNGTAPVLRPEDPNEAVRMQSLVDSVTQDDFDFGEELRKAQASLELEEAKADRSAADAAKLREDIAEQLEQLAAARDEQELLTIEAENRYEARLAEAQFMQEQEADLAKQITEKNSELQRQLAQSQRSRNPAAGQNIPGFPTEDELEKVDIFWVHEDIAPDLRALLDAARADNIILKGWGYRSHQRQIELRRKHCGTSEYAVWRKPSSQCRPPTARPGASNHERGVAIDFTYNGRAINTRSSPAFKWLNQHAHKYGLYNLPSEPWHWSVNGN